MGTNAIRIGILAIQGAVSEHETHLSRLDGVSSVQVRSERDLDRIDGLILPGGESTAIAKNLRETGLMDRLRSLIRQGLPVWGTCAGLILLARGVLGEEPHLGTMDIQVQRNAFGRQIHSFTATADIPQMGILAMSLIFIRAPWIESIGPDVTALLEHEGKTVAARQHHMLVTSFHPELTDSSEVHRYFIDMIATR